VVYLAWAIPYVRSDLARGRGATRPQDPDAAARAGGRLAGADAHAGPRVSLLVTLALLGIGGVGSAFVSDWFVSALRPAIDQLHLSQAFAGLVIVALAGNAVENTAGIVLAWKGQSDLAISVIKNSVVQVAAFLFPLLVLISLALTTTLTFAMSPVYVGALALSALAVWQVTGDGEAIAFEGWALIALYAIVATITIYE